MIKCIKNTRYGNENQASPSARKYIYGCVEHNILSHATLKPSYYSRYIDDIFILWLHPEADLKQFLLHMNSLHISIKFTSKYGSEKITILDVIVYKSPNFITTNRLNVKTFIKPTNNHAFVPNLSIPADQQRIGNR